MRHPSGDSSDESSAFGDWSRADLTTSASDYEPDPNLDPAPGAEAVDAVGRYGPPRVDQVFFGRYLVVRKIGEGGMGSVWLVRHIELDALRAVKLIVSGSAFDPQMRARFRREARAMARLSHPNAVTVHDVRIGRETAFIEMEYVRGESLNNLIRPGVPMPLEQVARILEQLCDVLQEAHERRIVHRDLKPSNLMLVADRPPGKELLKVLDFGIAKVLEADASTTSGDVQTGTGTFLGSAPWTSPEQANGREVDGRSDLYSVGILLYELLTGARPFRGPLVRLVYDHQHTPPPRFATTNPDVVVPDAVEQVVLRCLSKDPDDRPQTARDLAAEFLWALHDDQATPGPSLSPSPSSIDPAQTRLLFTDPLPDAPAPPPRLPLSPTDQPFTPLPTEPQTLETAALAEHPTWTATDVATPRRADVATTPTSTAEPEAGPAASVRPLRLAVLLMLLFLTAGLIAAGLAARSARSTAIRIPEGYRAEPPVKGGLMPQTLVRIGDGARFVRIAGGTFLMGNSFDPSGSKSDEDQPAHPVSLSTYYLQATEVTNGQMDAYFLAHKVDRKSRPRRFQEAWDRIEKAGRDPRNYPAVGISHALAEQYARWVGGQLPTEAQWEYAARSLGKPYRYVWPGEEQPSRRLANIDSLAQDLDLTTSEVRTFPKDRTEQGIYDMTGNVREWCRDRWAKYVPSQTPLLDPQGPQGPDAGPLDFVIRGGSFATWADQFRTTRPRRADPGDPTTEEFARDGTDDDLGFRVVLEWPRNP